LLDVPDVGVYIHFPWCRNLCPYCDFPVVVARRGIPHDEYLRAVLVELDDRAPLVTGRRLVSIYFGGGTPSLWRPRCLAAAISEVCARFELAEPERLEITLEANPADCTPEGLDAWRSAGINRLSIGVQSFRPGALAVLGRDHRMGDGAAALDAAVGHGGFAVSADIIFGTPGHAEPAADPSVLRAADAGVDHLSVYELTIEERTRFGRARRRGELTPTDDDTLAAQYRANHAALTARGFEHYEISSYARPGRRAVHNGLYWRGAEYLGLGMGAASFVRLGDGGRRWSNHRGIRRYLAARGDGREAEREDLDAAALAADRLWLGLRTDLGVPAAAFAGRPGALAWLLEADLVRREGDRVRPTLRGFAYGDRIMSVILGDSA
jgi:putative oxygen-independent coproporphyrinogen III oxidase